MSENDRQSRELFDRGRHVIPGGVNSPVRAFSAVGGTPRFIDRGEGAFLCDVDGNRYIDYVMSWGPLIHGHAYPPVIEAIQSAAAGGTSFGAPNRHEIELAETIVEAMPAIEMVRFVNSGTEAAMSAIRLARAFTGRDRIVKFAGNYHGHADSLLVRAGSGSLTLGVPTSPGVPPSVVESTMMVAYNDVDGLVASFDQFGPEIAAVIVEPVAANMGVIPPEPSFLQCIRELTESAGSVFIADEVITGFRVGPAGAQGLMDFSPDLTILGKIIGGGLPVGAYAGRREIMSRVAPEGPVYQAGTLSGNPLAMAAGIANLAPLREPAFYETLDTATHQLAQGLRGAADRARVPVSINQATGMLTVFFSANPVETLGDAERCDTAAYARFFHAMLDRGVYLPPSQFEAWMISSQHTESINERAIRCASEAFAAM